MNALLSLNRRKGQEQTTNLCEHGNEGCFVCLYVGLEYLVIPRELLEALEVTT